MRSSTSIPFGLGLVTILAFGAVGCRDDIRVQSANYNESVPAGTLVHRPRSTGGSSPWEGMTGTTLETPTASPSAIGGGPPAPTAANPPTGANDEGSPNMSEEPSTAAKPDASAAISGSSESRGASTQ